MQIDNEQVLIDESSKEMSQAAQRKGFWFLFEHEGNDISIFGSAWSGKEKVYFNNKEVSSFRNLLSFSGTHEFSNDDNHYKVVFKVTSALKGEVTADLYCNDELLCSESKRYTQTKGSKWGIAISALIGAVCGFTIMYMLLR